MAVLICLQIRAADPEGRKKLFTDMHISSLMMLLLTLICHSAFTYFITVPYVQCFLALLMRIQVNIVGNKVYVAPLLRVDESSPVFYTLVFWLNFVDTAKNF